jgi:hypothetical protein
MSNDQLRADLEALHESLQQGWTRFPSAAKSPNTCRHFGFFSRGCLGMQMAYVIKAHKSWGSLTPSPIDDPAEVFATLTEAGQARFTAMAQALGLTEKESDETDSIIVYNDAPHRSWDEVKERVKDAIGKL